MPYPKVLLVNDYPETMSQTVDGITEAGFEIVKVLDTESALAALRGGGFSAMISDIRRGADSTAGISLLKRAGHEHIAPPTVFAVADYRPELGVPDGAFGIADSHPEIVDFALVAMGSAYRAEGVVPDPVVGQPVVELEREISVGFMEYLRRHPKRSGDLHSDTFEKVIAEIVAGRGWKVGLTLQCVDGGADIVAVQGDVGGVGHVQLIECKRLRSDRVVSVSVVRSLLGVLDVVTNTVGLPVHSGMVVTTSRFGPPARRLASMGSRPVLLKGAEELADWLNWYRPHPFGKLWAHENQLVLPRQFESWSNDPLLPFRFRKP